MTDITTTTQSLLFQINRLKMSQVKALLCWLIIIISKKICHYQQRSPLCDVFFFSPQYGADNYQYLWLSRIPRMCLFLILIIQKSCLE